MINIQNQSSITDRRKTTRYRPFTCFYR